MNYNYIAIFTFGTTNNKSNDNVHTCRQKRISKHSIKMTEKVDM